MHAIDLPKYATIRIDGQLALHVGSGRFLLGDEARHIVFEMNVPENETPYIKTHIPITHQEHPHAGNDEPRKRILVLAHSEEP
jgi:hypothetical protein